MRSISSAVNGNVGFSVTFGGRMSLAGLRSIQPDSFANRKNVRKRSSFLAAETAPSAQVSRNCRSRSTSS
jgi:hypothetical protein